MPPTLMAPWVLADNGTWERWAHDGSFCILLQQALDIQGRWMWMLDVKVDMGEGYLRMLGGKGYGAHTPQAADLELLKKDALDTAAEMLGGWYAQRIRMDL